MTTYCSHCKTPVRTACSYGGGGTYWTHWDGYRDCPPTYASPNLQPEWEAHRLAQAGAA